MGDFGTLGKLRKQSKNRARGYGNIRSEIKVKPREKRPKAMPKAIDWLESPPIEEPRRNLRKLDRIIEKLPTVKCKYCDFVIPRRWTNDGEEVSSLLSHMSRCNPELAKKIRDNSKLDHFRGLGL